METRQYGPENSFSSMGYWNMEVAAKGRAGVGAQCWHLTVPETYSVPGFIC